MKNKIIGITLIIISGFIFIFAFIFGGHRFTSLAAAKANSSITSDYQIVENYGIENGLIRFYLFKSDEKQEYRTVIVNKKFLTYQSNFSTAFPYNNDVIQTVGGMSGNFGDEAATLFVVNPKSEEIDYIEIDTDSGKVKKFARKEEFVYFLLPYNKQINQLNAIAYNKNGDKLYYYGYESEYPETEKLMWYKIKGDF